MSKKLKKRIVELEARIEAYGYALLSLDEIHPCTNCGEPASGSTLCMCAQCSRHVVPCEGCGKPLNEIHGQPCEHCKSKQRKAGPPVHERKDLCLSGCRFVTSSHGPCEEGCDRAGGHDGRHRCRTHDY